MSDFPTTDEEHNGAESLDASLSTVRVRALRGRFVDAARFIELEWPDGQRNWFRMSGPDEVAADWVTRRTVQASAPRQTVGRVGLFAHDGSTKVVVRAGIIRPRGLRPLRPGQYVDRRVFQTPDARRAGIAVGLLSFLALPLWLARDFWVHRLPSALQQPWAPAVLALVAVATVMAGRRRVVVDGAGVRRYGAVRSRFIPWTDVVGVSLEPGVARVQFGNGQMVLTDRPQTQPWPEPESDAPRLSATLVRFFTDGPETSVEPIAPVALSRQDIEDERRLLEWRRYRTNIWWAYWLTAAVLVACTMAGGDVVQRSHLVGWTKTTGVIMESNSGDVFVRHAVGGDVTDVPLPGWLGADFDAGARMETWVHPDDPREVLIAENTPLHTGPYAAPVGLIAAAAVVWLLVSARSRRRRLQSSLADSTVVVAASRNAPGEWLAAAVVPMLICVGSLGYLIANPEISGDLQLGVAGITYLAVMYALHKWMRVDFSRLAQRPSDAA